MHTSLIFCSKCGRSVPQAAAFCPGCGAAIVAPGEVGNEAQTVRLAESAVSAPIATGPRPVAQPTGPFQIGDEVASRYTILKLLGVGGMGAVYQAYDHELLTGVAIKVIHHASLADETVAKNLEQRFKRELILARQITHKHVVRIHDIGDVDGIKYLTMPYIEGETLAELLRREGKLPVARALQIVTQVAMGLAAAHEKGVVHRDLKPENIMIQQETGDALIMDFGIARSVQRGGTQTAAGSVVGTIEYMAPEQAQGRTVDGRADLYALGLILYDCLVGRQRLVKTENPMTELLSRIGQAPVTARSIDGTIPEPIDHLLQRCLSPEPDQRFENTTELVRALEALTPEGNARPGTARTTVVTTAVAVRRPAWQYAAAAVLVLVAGIGGWWLSNRSASQTAAPREPLSVLVAQFDNRTGDPVFDGVLEQALSLGLESATFITAYPQREALRSAAAIKAGSTLNEATARLVAVRDGVKLVLAGHISAAGSGYDIAVRAIDAAEGREVATVNESAGDKGAVLTAVGELAASLRQELGDTDAGDDISRETFTAASLEAARAYVLGQELTAAGRFNEAMAQYQEAIQRDPNFGRAYSGWATAAFRAGRTDEAERLFQQSLSFLDRMNEREKFRTLGTYQLGTGNPEPAIDNYRLLLEKYPYDATALNNLGFAYFQVLDFKQAAEYGRKAAAVYPNNLTYRANLALYALYASDFATAVDAAQKLIAASPTDKAYLPIAVDALMKGDADAARAAYDAMAKISPRGASIASLGRADIDMFLGRLDEARAELLAGIALDEAGKLVLPRALKLIALAEIEAISGRLAESDAWLKEALAASTADAVVVPAGRLLAQAGKTQAAAAHAEALEKQLPKQTRALGAVVRAEILLAAKKPGEAVEVLTAARNLADLWLVRYMLGRALVEQGRFKEALTELEACQTRAGETTDVFLGDWPTVRYTVPIKYWLGRAHDGLGSKDSARKNYEAYLALREKIAGDSLAADARQRISQ